MTWSNVTSGQTFTKAQIDAGQLRFTPNANESGTDGYGGTGIGNKQADYAQFKFQPTDGKDLGTAATVKVDITPVADAPNLTVADNAVNSVGLTKQSWNSIANLGTSGNGAAPADLKNAIDNAGTPNTSTTVHGGHLVEERRLDDLQAGLEQFGTDHHGERTAEQKHGESEPQVHGADVFVVGGKHPAHQALGGAVGMVGVTMVIDYSAHGRSPASEWAGRLGANAVRAVICFPPV